MTMYPYGHDYGNAETCGTYYLQNFPHSKVMPSATSQGSLTDLARKRSALGDSYQSDAGALLSHEHVLELNGSELFVGELALSQSRTSSTARGDIHRYWSERSLELLLTVSGTLIPDTNYELLVVTGLPVETFSAENRVKVRAALEGEHHFKLDGRNRRATVKVAKVIMEGAGATIIHGLSEKVKQGTIDIGGRTTDLFAAYGQEPLLDLCKGKDIGVEKAGDLLNMRFYGQYGRMLKSDEIRRLFFAYAHNRAYPHDIYVNGAEVHAGVLQTWTEAAFREVGRDIASFVGAVWNASESGAIGSDLATILLVGGGAYYFERELRARIPHIKVPPSPEEANAQGYAALAVYVHSKLRAQSVAS